MLLTKPWLMHWLDEVKEVDLVVLVEATEEVDLLVLIDAEEVEVGVENVVVLDEVRVETADVLLAEEDVRPADVELLDETVVETDPLFSVNVSDPSYGPSYS